MRQSGHAFNQKLHKFLINEGWTRLNQDLAVYTRVRDGKLQIIACFVDDILLAGVGDSFRHFKNTLKEKFKITFQKAVDQYCGIEIDHNVAEGTYEVHQRSYVKQLHEKFARYLPLRHTPAEIPFPARLVLQPATDADHIALESAQVPYSNLVMSLLYMSRVTRLDISFHATQLCRFMQKPGMTHWKYALQVFSYVLGSSDTGIVYSPHAKNNGLVAFVDSEFGTADPSTRRSFTGNVTFFAGAPVAWSVKQLPKVGSSSSETEYMGLKFAADRVKATRLKILGMGFPEDVLGPTTVFCDNQLAIAIANVRCNTNRTKSIDNVWHCTRQYIEEGSIKVKFCSTKDMLADFLTKPLSRVLFQHFRQRVIGYSEEYDDLLTRLHALMVFARVPDSSAPSEVL